MPNPPIAGIVYERGAPIRTVMKAFVDALRADGVKVRGILQESPEDLDPAAAGCGVDAIDIDSGDHVPLVRPTQYELDNNICSMNVAKLAEASMILRRALEEHAEIVVVEKFGKHEKDGGGLSDDLMAVMAENIPTVVSVPENELESWQRFTGGLGAQLPCDLDQILAWWQSLKS
ncbi:DUF2478 domain-containing protein [Magnetovibrio sp.]|uniref:DUF2478 domain-containing protein n=1 Tax=Magnetovibrio sp. TaxID=2024836 RepID=UPI002F94176D